MNINICGVREVCNNIDYIKRNNINLISIRDTSGNKEYYDIIDNAGLKNLLVVNFDDIIESYPNRSEKAPEESDIRKILEWAKQKMSENNNDFIIHCTAGISRSSAVAILVNYLQNPNEALKVINPILHSPNEKVLELGEKILETKDIKEPTKEILEKYNDQWLENLGKNPNSLL